MSTTHLEDSFDDASTQTEDVSGRWICDQLRDVAEDSADSTSVSALEQATAEALGETDSETVDLMAAIDTPVVEHAETKQPPSEPVKALDTGSTDLYEDLASNISKALRADCATTRMSFPRRSFNSVAGSKSYPPT